MLAANAIRQLLCLFHIPHLRFRWYNSFPYVDHLCSQSFGLIHDAAVVCHSLVHTRRHQPFHLDIDPLRCTHILDFLQYIVWLVRRHRWRFDMLQQQQQQRITNRSTPNKSNKMYKPSDVVSDSGPSVTS